MKYFKMEPSYKKSVVENTIFTRLDEEGNTITLTKEVGWRGASWLISVPETQEEIDAWVESRGYETLAQLAEDFGHAFADKDGNVVIDEDFTLEDILIPSLDDDNINISEDYPDADFLESWDGCWESWDVNSYQTDIDEDALDAFTQAAQSAYEENYEDGVEALGWEYIDNEFLLTCSPIITACNEYGEPDISRYEEEIYNVT